MSGWLFYLEGTWEFHLDEAALTPERHMGFNIT